MTFGDDIDEDLADVFDTSVAACDAAYQALGVAPGVTVQVVPNERSLAIVVQGGNQRLPRKATFLCRLSQVASVNRTDKFVIASGDFAGTWTVETVGARQGRTVMVEVSRDAVREFAGQNVRQVLS